MSLELIVKGVFGRLGYQIQQAPRRLWEGDAVFAKALAEIQGTTLVSAERAYLLYQCARQAAALPGQAAELGVYRGGTARILAKALGTQKTLHLFDTFSGLPQADAAKDLHRQGDFSNTSLDSVRAFLADCPGLEFHTGFFPQSADALQGETFCLAHVDVDLYQSVRDGCAFFYPRLTPGGFLIIDDYGLPSCPGANQAVDEFFAGRRERPLALSTGQCLIVKCP